MSVSGSTASFVTGATATTSLAAIEAMTGISIPMFVWGAVGGLWAFWYLAPMSLAQRLLSLLIAALLASVVAKPASMIVISAARYFCEWWPSAVDDQLVVVPIALVIGLLCHTVIGRRLINLARRGMDEVLK